jgi:hypothetical protein
MALEDDFKKVTRDGVDFHLELLPALSVMRIGWILTGPATGLTEGPLNLLYTIFKKAQSSGILAEGKLPTIEELLTLDIDFKESLADIIKGFKEFTASLSPDELEGLMVALMKGTSVSRDEESPFSIKTGDDFNKAFAGCLPETMFMMAFEIMRFNRFPFLRRVTGDSGGWLEKISLFIKGLTNDDEEQENSGNSEN